MLKIYIANISVIAEEWWNIISLISKQNYILTISDNQITITSDKTLKYILWLNSFYYIINEENLLKLKDFKNNKTYTINIHNKYNELSSDIFINQHKKLSIKEKSIKDNIISNFNTYFPNLEYIATEYNTPLWNIDILSKDSQWIYHIFELKKKSTDINTIDQVIRYWKYFEDNNYNVVLYVLWIKNNNKNKDYAIEKNVKILEY